MKKDCNHKFENNEIHDYIIKAFKTKMTKKDICNERTKFMKIWKKSDIT